MGKINDLTGKIFGNLLVLQRIGTAMDRHVIWQCRCSCGNIVSVQGNTLICGTRKSCGCINKSKIINKDFYNLYKNIKQRCLNKKHPKYKDWGGRGINICSEWLVFKNFENDMYNSYTKHINKHGRNDTSIDRIDNNRGYYKENCKWSTNNEQAGNKRNNKKFIAISPTGEKFVSKNQSEFSRIHGLDVSHVNNCLKEKLLTHKGWKFNYAE